MVSTTNGEKAMLSDREQYGNEITLYSLILFSSLGHFAMLSIEGPGSCGRFRTARHQLRPVSHKGRGWSKDISQTAENLEFREATLP